MTKPDPTPPPQVQQRYRLTFERIGRGHRGEQHELAVRCRPGDEAEALAELVWRYVRGKLGSKWYTVEVDLEAMRGTIEASRFGTFTIEALP